MLSSYSKILHPHNVKKSTEAHFGARKEIAVEMMAEKIKFMYCEKNLHNMTVKSPN